MYIPIQLRILLFLIHFQGLVPEQPQERHPEYYQKAPHIYKHTRDLLALLHLLRREHHFREVHRDPHPDCHYHQSVPVLWAHQAYQVALTT